MFSFVSSTRRRQVGPLFALMLVGALAELVTIGAILPFLALISGSGDSRLGRLADPVLALLPWGEGPGRLYVLTALFAATAIVAAGVRLLLLHVSTRFVFGVAHDLGVELFRRMLYQPYAFHMSRNSSEILGAVNKVQMVTNEVLLPVMQAVSSAVIALFIIVGLVLIDPVVALVAGIGFAAIYLVVMRVTRTTVHANSRIIAAAQSERVQYMREGLGGIRDVLIDRSQPHFVGRVAAVEARFRDARASNTYLSGAPRYLVEGAGMVLIAVIAVMLSTRPGGLVGAIPVLGALALGSQRLLPLLQQLYNGWSRAVGSQQSLADLLELLALPMRPELVAPQGSRLPFAREIVLDKVSFRYAPELPFVVEDVSLVIPRGARVGFVGKTGSGKSTLMDLVLGLLEPSAGEIRVDGVVLDAASRGAWQSQVAHVPQAIYLADASVAANIAFGVPAEEIDMVRVRRAAERAELAEVVAGLPLGYETLVGERGIRLSGGQRQRLGIARALYKEAQVLVFDEATSALDTETEAAVMGAIDSLSRDLTILIIAHRLSTVEGCDEVVALS